MNELLFFTKMSGDSLLYHFGVKFANLKEYS